MGTEGRIEKGHGDFTPDHRRLTVSDLAMEAVMNFANWPLGVSAVRSLPAGPEPLSREIQREPKEREPT